LNEEEARERGYDVVISYGHPADHTRCYPGAAAIRIKTIADAKDGRLLGAQLIGSRGIDKRVDVLAMAIYGGMTVGDLFHVDLAYALPFSPAKDPVLAAGVVTENELKGDVRTILPHQLKQPMDMKDDCILLDVRTSGEFAAGHLEGAIHIHVDELRTRIDAVASASKEDALVSAGIRDILNFAPARVAVPEDVILQYVDLSIELDRLCSLLEHPS